jgi:SOS-response transcriptional repressor LexA
MLVAHEGKSTLKRIVIKSGRVFLQWEDGSGKKDEVKEEGYQVLGKFLRTIKSARRKP